MRLLLALACVFACLRPAQAQDEAIGGSFITPFPANDVYRVQVIGDSLAEGLIYGFIEAFTGDNRLQIERKVDSLPGVMRQTFDGNVRALEERLQGQPLHIAVVMVGAWDRVSARASDGKRLAVGSEDWKFDYGRRIDRLLRTLKKSNTAIYWVGLPIMRKYNSNEDVQLMNEVARERVFLAGQKFIDAYSGFMDEQGNYEAYGPDLTGKIKLLRDPDGIHFTGTGYRKLAHFIERELKRDLITAKNERSIPLAGTDAEQARVATVKPVTKPETGAATPPAASDAGAASRGTAAPAANPWAPAASNLAGAGEQKAEHGRATFKALAAGGREEMITVDLPRPAISASVLALVTRRESPDKLSQMGEALVDQLPGGLTVMNSITSVSGVGADGRRKTSPTQSPYFRVLVKGERMAPRPGRADDASWPKFESPDLSPEAAGRFAQPAAALARPPAETGEPPTLEAGPQQ